MEKETFIQQLLQKGKDNSSAVYMAGFFMVLIVLILFVAWPAVGDYVDKQRQLEELTETSNRYTKAIVNVSELQGILEAHRQDFKMLDEAIPNDLTLYQLTQDVENTFLQYTLSKSYTFPAHTVMNVHKSGKTDSKSELNTYKLLADLRVDYNTAEALITAILNQRRLKSINTLTISRESEASSGGQLEMKIEMDAYYL